MTNVGVFCGANPNAAVGIYKEETERLATALAKAKYRLIYGGSTKGLMGVLADSFLLCGGEVAGVMPEFLMPYEISHKGLTEFYIVSDLFERKKKMIAVSDIFVILPGGLGTCDEFFEVWSLCQLKQIDKPIFVLNTNNFFKHLFKFLDHSYQESFLRAPDKEMIVVKNNTEDLLQAIQIACGR